MARCVYPDNYGNRVDMDVDVMTFFVSRGFQLMRVAPQSVEWQLVRGQTFGNVSAYDQRNPVSPDERAEWKVTEAGVVVEESFACNANTVRGAMLDLAMLPVDMSKVVVMNGGVYLVDIYNSRLRPLVGGDSLFYGDLTEEQWDAVLDVLSSADIVRLTEGPRWMRANGGA